MSYSGDAAEQIVRMSLNGVEVAAKISGKAAERLAVLLYAVLKDQKRTKGKIRLTNMLRSGKELKVFAVKDEELPKFSKAAKQYGVLYCVLKDRNKDDGLTDVMARADDAGKINRIFERFSLASIDMGSVRAEAAASRDAAAKGQEAQPAPERMDHVKNKVDEFMEKVMPEKEEMAEKGQNENPTEARSAKSSQSGHSSGAREDRKNSPEDEERSMAARPSVRKELEEIRKEQKEAKKDVPAANARSQEHRAPARKRRRGKEKGT